VIRSVGSESLAERQTVALDNIIEGLTAVQKAFRVLGGHDRLCREPMSKGRVDLVDRRERIEALGLVERDRFGLVDGDHPDERLDPIFDGGVGQTSNLIQVVRQLSHLPREPRRELKFHHDAVRVGQRDVQPVVPTGGGAPEAHLPADFVTTRRQRGEHGVDRSHVVGLRHLNREADPVFELVEEHA
jgi:hypothetical protein